MKIDFGQMYGSYDKDQILSALRKDVLSALNSMYGNQLDAAVQKRFEQEWLAMEQSDTVLDVAALYEMTIWLKANSIPYWMRGCSGSSLILYLLGITCGNPLPPHYRCPKCHQIRWDTGHLDGFDLSQDKLCEQDGTPLIPDGHNIPWQTLWGYGESIPVFDIDLPAYLYDDFAMALETHWLNQYRFAADYDSPNDTNRISKHFFNISFMFVLDDVVIHKLFHTKVVNASCVQMALSAWQTLLNYTKQYDDEMMPPDSFADLISFLGITCSTGAWDEATYSMSTYLGYELSDMIAFRDDIYQYLLAHGFLEKDAWRGMERVRKGLELPVITEEMRISRDKWVLNRCDRIAYLIPKSHVVEYILFRLKAMILPESEHRLFTGYEELDRTLAGIDQSDVILLGARPGVGKTRLAMDIAEHISAVENKNVAVFTHANKVNFTHSDIVNLWRGTPNLSVCAEDSLNIKAIHNIISANKVDFIVIDCLQALKELQNRNAQTVKAVMREIKNLAKETNIPILLLSHLSRKVDRRKGRFPLVEDIPWHESVISYVDMVCLLYREAYYDANADKSEAWCFVKKNVHGWLGEVLLKINWEIEVVPQNPELNYKFVSALFQSLPSLFYNSVFICTKSAQIDDFVSELCDRCVVQEVDFRKLSEDILNACDCLVIKGFEEIEGVHEAQENLISIINKALKLKTQIILISQKEYWELKIDERLHARISWGIHASL